MLGLRALWLPGRLCVWPWTEQPVLGEGRVGTNASVQGKNEQVRIFKTVLFFFSQTPLSAIQEPGRAQQGCSSAQCGQSFSCMRWSLSSVINVATLKHPAVGSTFCPQMHVCGFHAAMGTVYA